MASFELLMVKLAILGIVLAAGCAKGAAPGDPDGGTRSGSNDDSAPTCATDPESCSNDSDGDGVTDDVDQCAGTLAGAPVNHLGCSDAQVDPVLEPTFPPFSLAWVPTGELGRAGGLTWTYTGIARGELFHIDWVVCDDPMPCGISLDGPIDQPAESWKFSAVDSDLAMGKLGFTNVTNILLADATSPALNGRLTLRITDTAGAVLPAKSVTQMGITTARSGTHGAEITGTDFRVVALAEVQDPTSGAWTPYNDYYDAASTPEAGGTSVVSFGGSFYSE